LAIVKKKGKEKSKIKYMTYFVLGVTANCLHPGMIDSGIWRNVPFPLNLPIKVIAKTFFKVRTNSFK